VYARVMRNGFFATAAFALGLALAAPGHAQDLQDREITPPPPSPTAPAGTDEIEFSANQLEYNYETEIIVASGDVRLFRDGNRLRADNVTWNRTTGKVMANGNIAVVNPQGDVAYGDSIELTDSLKDGVVENLLIVLDEGGRLAAQSGTRGGDLVTLDRAAYTPCAVVDSEGCPKDPVWKIEAVRVTYDQVRERMSYRGARFSLFGLTLPLPNFSHPTGDLGGSGLLVPNVRYDSINGVDVSAPYYFRLAPNRDLIVTPRVFSNVVPMISGEYRALTGNGAYRVAGHLTYSDVLSQTADAGTTSQDDIRGYLDASGRFQLSPEWSISGSLRVVTDRTFLRRYQLSDDDRLRTVVKAERIDRDSYLSIAGWAVQTLRFGDPQGQQPIALPAIDYRRRIADPLLGGVIELQGNTLSLLRTEGQDTQRAFAGARWDLRKLTNWGQEVTFTAYARGDIYHTSDTLATEILGYRGEEGVQSRVIGALAMDVKWPFIGEFLGGTQRITPRVQLVAAPSIRNLNVPNEDARAVDLEDSNLFALNRFPGYDRFEDSARITYGVDYALDLPGLAAEATVGQSFRLDAQPTLFPDGTGLFDRTSDIVGRTRVKFRDFVTFTHRYRLDKDNLAVRRNEIDATIGGRRTYAELGYLRLNRDIDDDLEDLQDREEARVGGRFAFARFWSVFGSAVVDLTNRQEDPLSIADGYEPLRHRLGVAYEDDCIEMGLTWRRNYSDIGDARSGDSFLFRLAFKNLGR